MAQDHIGYGRLVENALRQVVRDALQHARREGLPEPHHFYITFRTDQDGVRVSERLRQRYPAEMTIVLQHQFWDLEVDDHGFGVTLSFGGVPERLEVPFGAVRMFADPSIEFGLQFQVGEADEPQGEAEAPETTPSEETEQDGAEIVALDRFRKKK
jgi:uncharacterized protein